MPARSARRRTQRQMLRAGAAGDRFDQAGKVVQGWGGDGPDYKWGNDGHGIHVDHNNFVWVADNVDRGGHIYKFTRDGKFVMRVGKPGTPGGSNDIEHLGRPPNGGRPRHQRAVRRRRLRQQRVIVFDAATGAYKRHWGAYGKPPSDEKVTWDPKGPPPQQFTNPVHCITITNDGLVLVCDRQPEPDADIPQGWHVRARNLRPEGQLSRHHRLDREVAGCGADLSARGRRPQRPVPRDQPRRRKLVGSYGRVGHQLGEFYNLHFIGIDSKGNVYSAEVQGKRVQKFRNLGGL